MNNRKRLLFAPLALIAVTLTTTACVDIGSGSRGGGGLNTVTVTFNATSDGYYPNSAHPENHDEVVIKEVRYGITWGKLVADHEKPDDPTCNKIGYSFAFYKLGNYAIQDNYKITSDISLNAVYSTDGHRFCYDPWDTVIQHANEGLDDLQKYYGIDPDYKANGNSFVGLERDLKYNDASYKVRVIAQNADDLVSGNNQVAALTFEFVELLPGFAYDARDTSHYETSSLRTALNGRVMNNMDETLRVNLQQVKKYTNEGGGTSGASHIKTTQDYVFIPSMYELGILNDENGDVTEREGYIYDYYREHNTINDRKKSYRSRSGQLVESTYWTRSPDTTVNSAVWPIDNNGHTGVESEGVYNTIDPAIALGVSPCFAIGVSTLGVDERPIFATDPWSKIIETANKGYAALKNRYKIDMANNNDTFIGLTHPIEVKSKNMTITYDVRVIGERHDYYYEYDIWGNRKKYTSPLTFQFTSVVGQQENMYVSGFVDTNIDLLVYNQKKNWHYYYSMVDHCLEDRYDYGSSGMDSTWSNASGGKTLLQMIPNEVANAINPSVKLSYGAYLIESVVIESAEYKLFPLSYNEYGAYQQNIDTYGKSFDQLIKDDTEKPYEYYDYTKVKDKDTKAEKYKEIEKRRVVNNVTEDYTTQTKSGITAKVPVLDKNNDGKTAWAHSYLRSINMVNFYYDGLFSGGYKQEYAMLHPTGEANDWAGMPMTESFNDYVQNHNKYRIGVVPAFAIGKDVA